MKSWPALVAACFLAACSSSESKTGPFVIETFGTSLTHYGGWQEPLASRLGQCLNRLVEVHNYGKGAKASDWGAETVSDFAQITADVALIEFAINDAYVPFGISLEASKQNTLAIIERVREQSPTAAIFLMTTNPTFNDPDRPSLQAYYDQYRAIAKDTDVGLIDLFPVWKAALEGADISALIPDGGHPSVDAYSKVLPTIAEGIAGRPC